MPNKLEFLPLGGLNSYDNYSRLGPTEVSDCRNILFEKQKCFNRPGLATTSPSVTGPLVFYQGLFISAVPYVMAINSTNHVIDLLYSGVLTGPAVTFGQNIYDNVCAVDGIAILGNCNNGLVQWTPGAGAYTDTPTAPFRYVTGHQGRAVATYQLTGGSAQTNPRTFAWCKPGDTTTWTSTDGSAGQLAVAEIESEITGVGTLHNIVVLPHRRGIHLAYPTGTLPLPYNVQGFVKQGIGCNYPSTSAYSDELYFFVGQDDVYAFDLTNITPIGNQIRSALFAQLGSGVNYRGFVTRLQVGNSPRWRYSLFPLNSAASPHFVYDVKEQKWSQHFYATAANWADNFFVASFPSEWGISFVNNANPPVVSYWQPGGACEQAAYFTRYMGVLEAQELDFLANDVLVRTVDHGALTLTATLTSINGDTLTTKSATKVVGGNGTGLWTRQFISRGSSDLRQAGQEFILTVSVPAGSQFECDYVAVLLANEPSGDYRGY